MNVHEYQSLLSEQAELRRLLDIRSPANLIGRMSLEWRLAKVEAKLVPYEGLSWQSDRVRLLFRGAPVLGHRGVLAEFGGSAVNQFAEAVAVVGSSLSGELADGGPVPRRDQYRLAITDTVSGSFGFELEDASQQLVQEGESSPVALAVAEVKKIISATADNDDALAEAVAGGNRRAIRAVREFLQTVADAGAVCSLDFGNDVFRFQDNGQVQRSVRRLREDNIVDDEVTLDGYFEGFLPGGRRAEFRVTHAGADHVQEAVGKLIGGQVERQFAESFDINSILKQQVQIQVRTRKVGSGRPRYVFRSVSDEARGLPGMENAALESEEV